MVNEPQLPQDGPTPEEIQRAREIMAGIPERPMGPVARRRKANLDSEVRLASRLIEAVQQEEAVFSHPSPQVEPEDDDESVHLPQVQVTRDR